MNIPAIERIKSRQMSKSLCFDATSEFSFESSVIAGKFESMAQRLPLLPGYMQGKMYSELLYPGREDELTLKPKQESD